MKQALAIFAKSPVPGSVKTRLTPPLSPGQAAELYRCMLLDTLARLRTLPVDTIIFHQGDAEFFRRIAPDATVIAQQDTCLGGRLEKALDQMAERGYTSRVVIGSDAPDLPVSYVEQAFARLGGGCDVVFGPAEDGGYYLVGVAGSYGQLFRGIPWSGPQVLEKSLERARQAGFAIEMLPSWYDIDAYGDLSRPGLADPVDGAPLTSRFIAGLGIAIP